MDTLGIALVWCAAQVSLLGLLAAVVYAASGRLGSGVRALIALTGLLLMVALSALSFSPWPRWWDAERSTARSIAVSEPADSPAEDRFRSAAATPHVAARPERHSVDAKPLSAPADEWSVSVGAFWQALRDQLTARPAPEETAAPRRWPTVVAVLFLIGLALAGGRLLLGVWAVRQYRRRSRPIADVALAGLRDVLQAELGCRRRVELRESPALVTAATVGWLRPLILLPPEWRAWTEPQRRAVLAHELAHVQRHDFLAWLGAELGLLLHFYHPLVHWLAGRLRLEQELAADAAAAALSGGQRCYLTSLAELALRQSDRPLSWPARAFLPTRRTFLRRIEMLRDARRFTSPRARTAKILTVGVLLAAALLVAGVRGPAAQADKEPAPPRDQPPAQPADRPAEPAGPLQLPYVPQDAVVVAAVRPAAVYARLKSPQLAEYLRKERFIEKKFGVGIDAFVQVTLVVFRDTPRTHPRAPQYDFPQLGGVIVQTRTAEQARTLFDKLAPDPTLRRYAGKRYYYQPGRNPELFYQPDETTLVIADNEPLLFRLMDAGPESPDRATWWDAWKTVRDAHAAVAVDMAWVRQMMNQPANPRVTRVTPQLALFAPLWNGTRSLALGLSLEGNLSLDGIVYSTGPEAAERVAKTLQAAAALARNLLGTVQQQVAQAPQDQRQLAQMMQQVLDVADAVLESVEIKSQDGTVRLHAETDADGAAPLVAAVVLPAIAQSREAARRAQSANNLKQIAIAMHNYSDTHGHFPPAVVLGPDGKTPHSWRVALLPYLEQQDLYNEYRLNEPWDSEHNKKVLAKMPRVYAHPSQPDGATHAAYYVVTSPNAVTDVQGALPGPGGFGEIQGNVADAPVDPDALTLFSSKPRKEGPGFPQISDGSSNTLLVVEAQRDIPWTKPEDIPFNAGKPLAGVGGYHEGGFNAALADGSVKFISENIAPEVFRRLMTPADGHPVGDF